MLFLKLGQFTLIKSYGVSQKASGKGKNTFFKHMHVKHLQLKNLI